jgi:hypothetical protein
VPPVLLFPHSYFPFSITFIPPLPLPSHFTLITLQYIIRPLQ